jgi:PAS domain S-box-containing protein
MELQLEAWGYEVVGTANSADMAIMQARKFSPDLMILDIRLKGELDGVYAAKQITKEINIPVIYVTAIPNETTIKQALKTNPYGYLIKPYDKKELKFTIEMALYRHQILENLKTGLKSCHELYISPPEIIIILDKDGLVRYANDSTLKLVGLKIEEIWGRSITEVVPEEVVRKTCESAKLALSTSENISDQLKFSNGEKVCYLNYHLFKLNTGKDDECYLVIGRDMTNKKDLEENIQKSVAEYLN